MILLRVPATYLYPVFPKKAFFLLSEACNLIGKPYGVLPPLLRCISFIILFLSSVNSCEVILLPSLGSFTVATSTLGDTSMALYTIRPLLTSIAPTLSSGELSLVFGAGGYGMAECEPGRNISCIGYFFF